MGRLIDADELLKQPINTANYPSNFVKLAPTVEAIPKADYEARLKADLITMLVALQLQFASRHCKDMRDCWWLIEDKINALKGETDDK